MENDSQPITKKNLNEAFSSFAKKDLNEAFSSFAKNDLREILEEAFAKFAQDILMPAFESIDAKFEVIDRRFEALESRFDAMDAKFEALKIEMHTGFNDVNAELFSIKQEIKDIKISLDRLDKRTAEDGEVNNQDIIKLQKRLDRLEKMEPRLAALEAKQANT